MPSPYNNITNCNTGFNHCIIAYCKPDNDPVEIADTGARIYVLGPPRDPKQIVSEIE